MFSKLTKRIYLPIVLIAAVLIMFIDIFAVVMLANTLNDSYTENGQNMAERAASLLMVYINSISSETHNLATDESVIAVLNGNSNTSIVSRLNNACNYSLRIDAICVYTVNGDIYTSSEISEPPSLDELMTNDDIAAYISGNEDFFVSFRKDNIAKVYHNVSYQQSLGVVTCCRKVYDDVGNTIGYILADVLPSNLYSYIITGLNLEDSVTFISYDGMYFEYANNSENEKLLSGNYSGWFKFEVTLQELSVTLTIFTDNGEYVSAILIMTAILVCVSVILLVLVYFLSHRISKKMTDRLNNLTKKINSAKLYDNPNHNDI